MGKHSTFQRWGGVEKCGWKSSSLMNHFALWVILQVPKVWESLSWMLLLCVLILATVVSLITGYNHFPELCSSFPWFSLYVFHMYLSSFTFPCFVFIKLQSQVCVLLWSALFAQRYYGAWFIHSSGDMVIGYSQPLEAPAVPSHVAFPTWLTSLKQDGLIQHNTVRSDTAHHRWHSLLVRSRSYPHSRVGDHTKAQRTQQGSSSESNCHTN